MAQLAMIVFTCDFCGEEEAVKSVDDSTMLEFEVKQSRPKPKSKKTLVVHYHENHIPEGFVVLTNGTSKEKEKELASASK